MTALLPCPFCGASDHLVTDFGITCRACHTQVVGSGVDSDEVCWNTRPSPARDEGAGTMGRGEEALDQLRKAAIEALALYDVAVMAAQFTKPGRGQVIVNVERAEKVMAGLRAAIMGADPAAPVSAPGVDREAVARIIEPWAMGRAECDPGTEEIRAEAYAKADQIIALQRDAAPADGSQVEPSTTGTGRHIPLEPPPFIQWNGGENPAPGKVVDVMFRNGEIDQDVSADVEDWAHSAGGARYDIVGYRIPTDDQGGEGT